MNVYQVTINGYTWRVEASSPKVAISRIVKRVKLTENRTMTLHFRTLAKGATLREFKENSNE